VLEVCDAFDEGVYTPGGYLPGLDSRHDGFVGSSLLFEGAG
jgi:hypothetical protein